MGRFNIKHGKLAWRTIAPYWSKEIFCGTIQFKRYWRALPAEIKPIFATYWCNFEIENGGFTQFFYNSSGIVAAEALAGFRALRLNKVAQVISAAMKRLGPKYPTDRLLRWHALGVGQDGEYPLIDKFEDLTYRYYELLPWKHQRWERAADSFVRKHKAANKSFNTAPLCVARTGRLRRPAG